jgi:hypothetical protein
VRELDLEADPSVVAAPDYDIRAALLVSGPDFGLGGETCLARHGGYPFLQSAVPIAFCLGRVAGAGGVVVAGQSNAAPHLHVHPLRAAGIRFQALHAEQQAGAALTVELIPQAGDVMPKVIERQVEDDLITRVVHAVRHTSIR